MELSPTQTTTLQEISAQLDQQLSEIARIVAAYDLPDHYDKITEWAEKCKGAITSLSKTGDIGHSLDSLEADAEILTKDSHLINYAHVSKAAQNIEDTAKRDSFFKDGSEALHSIKSIASYVACAPDLINIALSDVSYVSRLNSNDGRGQWKR